MSARHSLGVALIPEQVCVPAHPGVRVRGGEPQVRVELRRSSGEPVAVAFSSVAYRILLDPDLQRSPGRWELADLRRLAGRTARG